jgi:3-hydroxybutyrate dehydrogenase
MLATMTRAPAAAKPSRALAGRVAIVTGSTSGIGLGVAKALAAQGAAVMLNGFGQPEEIERTRRELAASHHVEVAFCAADMRDPAQIEAMVMAAEAALGPVDILVNNAGIQHVAPIEEFPPAKWDAIIAINLSAAFHAIRSVFPGMKMRGFGRIVNVASAHGLVASPFKSWRSRAPSTASPPTPSAPAMSGRRWSSSRSRIRPGRTASRART